MSRSHSIGFSLLALAASGLVPAMIDPAHSATRINNVEVRGTTFRVTLAGGKTLEGLELAGATISVALVGESQPRRIRLTRIVPDSMDRDGEVLLYDMEVLDPATGGSRPLCEHEIEGEHWAFPLRGQWDRNGQRISDEGFTLTCAADAQGKCVRFGYKPWQTTPEGIALADYHQACVRMVRADYCGNQGTTRDGMLIDFHDQLDIQDNAKTSDEHDLPFEAAWNTGGAVCVAHTRVPENMTVETLGEVCPRLRGRLGEGVCTEAAAKSGRFGRVLLFNRSK